MLFIDYLLNGLITTCLCVPRKAISLFLDLLITLAAYVRTFFCKGNMGHLTKWF